MHKAVLAALTALFLLMPATAGAQVSQAESVLPPGNSGHVPQAGANPHLTDQLPLFESFAMKPAGFDIPGTVERPRPGITITRDAYGVRASRDWLGSPGRSHAFDFGGADGAAFLRLGTAGIRRAAARAAGVLSERFDSPESAAWREPRRMYDVEVTGVAPKPALRFYDRGTWQQSVELGP